MFAALEAGYPAVPGRRCTCDRRARLRHRLDPAVDKIVGPGNAYVAAAKALVAADCAIDFFAGPSEIAVVSLNGVAEWIAADLIAQAEHDPDARAILFTPSRAWRAMSRPNRQAVAGHRPGAAALTNNGGIVVTRPSTSRLRSVSAWRRSISSATATPSPPA